MTSGNVTAIPTIYRGQQFRSRLEARWAIVFDELNMDWVYEPEGYTDLSLSYLPDFSVAGILPASPVLVEIKPKWPSDLEWRKIDMINPLVFIGLPSMSGKAYLPEAFHYVICDGFERYVLSICRYCNTSVELLPTYMVDAVWPSGINGAGKGNGEGYGCCSCYDGDKPPYAAHPKLIDAYRKANQWKF